MNASDPARRLRDELGALDRAYSPGHQGLWLARRRAEIIDGVLAGLFTELAPARGLTLIALGGYGRREQVPHSDVDLLILHDGNLAPSEVAAFSERLLYPLWDAGLQVGQAVRTPAECVVAARERLDSTTAMLAWRPLAGDEMLAHEAHEAVLAPIRADPVAFAELLRASAEERRERFGSVAHLLEPELKEGQGGLRDIAVVGWLEAALGDTLDHAGLLRAREREALDAAAEFLTRVRSALHLETGRRTDRLPLEHQAAVAQVLGFTDEPGLIAEDALMRTVFEHARQVLYVVASVLRRYLDETEPVDPPVLDDLDAAAVLAVLLECASDAAMSATWVIDALEAADVPVPVVWTPEVRDGFLELLRAGDRGADALEVLDRLGLLVRYLPAWAAVRCRPQRDPYHRYTVDTHLTGALRSISRMLGGLDVTEDAVEQEAVKQVDDIDGVLLGALLHDIGKVGLGSHVEIGSRIAADTLAAMEVDTRTGELASFMVAHHLLLPDTATRRDLTDENLVLDVAATVGSPSRLAALYLLAKADAAATGPAAWTPWRRALIRELVVKVQRVFDRGEMGTELAEQLTERIGRVRDLLEGEPEAEVERFILRMPRGYFLSVEPARAARHFTTIAPDIGRHEVRTAAAPGAKTGTYELLVVANDRPRLLSWIAGALALAGLSILTAQVFTTDDDVAADLFEVEGAYEPEVSERRWREFRATLRKAIDGQITVERRVAEKRRFYPVASDVPVTVHVDNTASDFFTVIEVGAADRLGLLHDITAALAELRLDVHLAKVTTYTGRVIDAFYVRDALGGKITDAAQVAEIEQAVRGRLGEPAG